MRRDDFPERDGSSAIPFGIEVTGERELRLEGTVEARVALTIPAGAAPGAYLVAVTARFLACGEGVCLPARVLSLGVPVDVVA